jgi:hypothetical protein
VSRRSQKLAGRDGLDPKLGRFVVGTGLELLECCFLKVPVSVWLQIFCPRSSVCPGFFNAEKAKHGTCSRAEILKSSAGGR